MKRIFAGFLAAVLLISLLPVSVLAQMMPKGGTEFAGGDGSEGNPYLVSTPQQLDAVRQNLSAHYLQINDIDLSGWDNWEPIGTGLSLVATAGEYEPAEPESFTGSYNGGNYKITNLKIHDTDASIENDCLGLFGGSIGAQLENIHLENMQIIADRADDDYAMIYENCGDAWLFIGGICGRADDSHITDCTASGQITVTNGCNTYAGGIVGAYAKRISGCVSNTSMDIHANKNYHNDQYSGPSGTLVRAGGIIGYTEECDIELCANSGALRLMAGKSSIGGGICGTLDEGSIRNCANYAPIRCDIDLAVEYWISTSTYAGGIVATFNADYMESVSIEYCVNYGTILCQNKTRRFYDHASISAGGIAASGGAEPNKEDAWLYGCVNLAPSIDTLLVDQTNTISYVDACKRIIGYYSGHMLDCASLDQTLINGERHTGSEAGDDYYYCPQGTSMTAQQLLQESAYPGYDFKENWIIDSQVGGAVLREMAYEIQKPEPEPVPVTFVESLYRADQLINGPVGIHADPSLNVWLTTNGHSPCRALMDSMGEEMMYAVSGWNNLTTAVEVVLEGSGQLITKKLEQRDLIAAVLMESVRLRTEIGIADIFKDNTKMLTDVTTLAGDILQANHLTGEAFATYAKEHQGDILSVVDDYCEDVAPEAGKFLDTADAVELFGTICDMANSMEDLLEQYIACMQLVHLNNSTKEAFEAMYAACPAEYEETRHALSYIITVMNAANAEILSDLIMGDLVFSASLVTTSVLVDQVWQCVYDQLSLICPNAAMFAAAYELEKLVLEYSIGTDSRAEQYYKMGVITHLETICNNATRKALEDYQQDPTVKNAERLLGLVDMKFGLLRCDYREAIRFSEITFDQALVDKMILAVQSLFVEGEIRNTLKEQLEETQILVDRLYCLISTAWITALGSDHPELVPRYENYRQQMEATYGHRAEWEKPFFAAKAVIACPVNVYVYDANGTLVASVEDGKITDSQDVAVMYDNGEKTIYFYRSGEYSVCCKGYDQGAMDLTLIHYDASGNEDRVVRYNRLPVSQSHIYDLSFKTVAEPELVEPALKDTDNADLTPDMDSLRPGEEVELTVKNAYLRQADSLLRHTALPGEVVSVVAVIPQGYYFVGWRVTGGQAKFQDEKAPCTQIYLMDSDAEVMAIVKKLKDTDPEDPAADVEEPASSAWIYGVVAAVVAVAGAVVAMVLIRKRKKSVK